MGVETDNSYTATETHEVKNNRVKYKFVCVSEIISCPFVGR